jgi:hypothetical protein
LGSSDGTVSRGVRLGFGSRPRPSARPGLLGPVPVRRRGRRPVRPCRSAPAGRPVPARSRAGSVVPGPSRAGSVGPGPCLRPGLPGWGWCRVWCRVRPRFLPGPVVPVPGRGGFPVRGVPAGPTKHLEVQRNISKVMKFLWRRTISGGRSWRGGLSKEVYCCSTAKARLADLEEKTAQFDSEPAVPCWKSLQTVMPNYIEHYTAEVVRLCAGEGERHAASAGGALPRRLGCVGMLRTTQRRCVERRTVSGGRCWR